jgi:glutamate racemase
MMNNKPILFLDSGVGGLPYFELASKRLPHERFIYLADRKNFPYGDKDPDEVKRAVFDSLEKIYSKYEFKCTVIACNTASVIALADLRDRYSMPFIGVVPAVKPAALSSPKKRFVVLATRRTVEDVYLKNLLESFASSYDVRIVPAPKIVDLVEKRFFTSTLEEKRALLGRIVEDIKSLDVDSVVLGCTHFLHLIDQFKEVLGNGISIIDSREGVVNQLVRIISSMENTESRNGPNEFYVTGKPPVEERYRRFAKLFDLEFMGSIG